ncbi:glycerate kinase [Gemmatimonadota bacterium]
MSLASLRNDVLAIFQAGLLAADPRKAMERHLIRDGEALLVEGVPYPLDQFSGIRVVGMGKASAAMAQTLEEILGSRISGGAINVKYGHGRPLERIRVQEAGHPIPDGAGVEGTREILRLLEDSSTRELVFCLISGGGSALSPAPAGDLTLEDKQEVTRHLLGSGATIHEINAIRKHLSAIKGGRLAQAAYPSTLVSLLLSDVVGDDPGTIASGPTVPDPTTYSHCLEVLGSHGLKGAVPGPVLRFLEAGERGEVPETPKAGDPAFENTRTVVVGSNALALKAAEEKAAELGYRPLVLSSTVEGEAREVARAHAALAREIRDAQGPLPGPLPGPRCILSGGETTVTLRGKGRGGRNQEFALAGALEIQGLDGVVMLSGGTDGTDGPTDAAGALADGTTVERGEAQGLDARMYLDENDSYNFFQPLGDLLVTGPTFTNVMDLHLVLVE